MTLHIITPEAYQPLSKLLKRLAVAKTLVLAVFILTLALLPPPAAISGGINDKVLHFTAFATLVLPCAIFLARYLVRIVPLALLFGGAIELLQPDFGREASWPDLQADALGIAAGAVLGLTLRFLIKRYLGTAAHTHLRFLR